MTKIAEAAYQKLEAEVKEQLGPGLWAQLDRISEGFDRMDLLICQKLHKFLNDRQSTPPTLWVLDGSGNFAVLLVWWLFLASTLWETKNLASKMCEEFLEFTEVIDVRHLTCLKLRQFGWRVWKLINGYRQLNFHNKSFFFQRRKTNQPNTSNFCLLHCCSWKTLCQCSMQAH